MARPRCSANLTQPSAAEIPRLALGTKKLKKSPIISPAIASRHSCSRLSIFVSGFTLFLPSLLQVQASSDSTKHATKGCVRGSSEWLEGAVKMVYSPCACLCQFLLSRSPDSQFFLSLEVPSNAAGSLAKRVDGKAMPSLLKVNGDRSRHQVHAKRLTNIDFHSSQCADPSPSLWHLRAP